MNKRIKELAQQADEGYTGDSKDDMGASLVGNDAIEKFAELIVKECCDWIDGSLSTDAGQLLLTKSFIIANLKGHFGVEE